MRELQSEAAQKFIHLSPPVSSPIPTSTRTCEPHACRWAPFSGSKDFEANAAVVVIVLLCALICALALNAAIRCFLRGGNNHPPVPPADTQQQLQQQEEEERKTTLQKYVVDPLVAAPAFVYSAGMKLAGAEAECAICLSEFVEGEGIRVLGRCKHGFHGHCIEEWLSSHSSCPTCRRTCLPPSPSSTEPCQRNSSNSPTLIMIDY